MSTLVSGHFTSRDRAENAIRELIKAGFAPDAISLLATESRPEGPVAVEPGHRGHRIAAVGAGLGGALGALAGGVAAAGPLGTPESPILAVGPLLVAISGFVAGILVGGLGGAFVGHGIPRNTATFLEGDLEEEGTVAAVFVQDDRTLLVRSVLDTCGAEAISGK